MVKIYLSPLGSKNWRGLKPHPKPPTVRLCPQPQPFVLVRHMDHRRDVEHANAVDVIDSDSTPMYNRRLDTDALNQNVSLELVVRSVRAGLEGREIRTLYRQNSYGMCCLTDLIKSPAQASL